MELPVHRMCNDEGVGELTRWRLAALLHARGCFLSEEMGWLGKLCYVLTIFRVDEMDR
jgi:hypothetical protein